MNTPPQGFKSRFIDNLRRAPPLLLMRLSFAALLLLPWLIFSLISSWIKLRHWRRVDTCQNFIRRNQLAFEHLEAVALKVESKAGGMSNSNQIWKLKTASGNERIYFVKVFVRAGSFWAKNLSLVTPFPSIYGVHTHQRFTVDMVSRVSLADHDIPVPKLIAFDPVEEVMVTEYLQGDNVDEILQRISGSRKMEDGDKEALSQCGIGLAKVHQAGFSLIDTQPVNFIWVSCEKKVYFTDLEFCTREDKRIWDLGFFLCFLAVRLSENAELRKEANEVFIHSYQDEREVNFLEVDETKHLLHDYLPIFQTILDVRQFTPEELFSELLRT